MGRVRGWCGHDGHGKIELLGGAGWGARGYESEI